MSRVKGSVKTGGIKKGGKHAKTIQKEKEIEYIQAEIRKELEPIIKALIAKCKREDLPAIKEALDRLIGRSKESLDLTTGGEKLYGWEHYVKKDGNESKTKS